MDGPASRFATEYSLPEGTGTVGLARDFTRKTLTDWGYRGDHDDAVLATSELVANATRHGHGPPLLRLTGGASQVRIEVADGSPTAPRLREAGAGGGWGLALVQRLATRWGVTHNGVGKVVWCELAG